ncbi:Ribonuclease T2 precursor (RNase T2) [Entomophthora muscae]|uniref:Ribonuclease T2 (RNase T2) n=1 Tax=Entomophthora muscae TaxID=34485 RepID=A0ACC2UDI0_9FUNG|nr:Ribonuclease T2 precursor (RNase T2) [Entomophthora muscae]
MDKLDFFLYNHGYQNDDLRLNFVPEVSPLLHGKLEDECPDHARTCKMRKYDGCCVPELRELVFSQFWDKRQSIDASTIHGLWPSDCRTGYAPPTGCRTTNIRAEDVKTAVYLDSGFKEVMETYWPTRNARLWANEWNKHGTCLSTVESRCYLNDFEWNEMIRYFTVTLSLYTQFDIMQELSTHGVYPGANYTASDFFHAIPQWRAGMAATALMAS